MSRKFATGFSLFVLVSLIVTACAPAATPTGEAPPVTTAPGGATTAPGATAQPEEGAMPSVPYRVGVFEDLTSTNYWVANGPDNTVWNSYVLSPTRMALYGLSDKRFQPIPIAAADFATPLEQEGSFWVSEVTLKDGLTWNDGEPFTAGDVAFTANTVLRFGLVAGNWVNWVDGNYLDHAEAVDDQTVKLFYHTRPGLARHDWGTLQMPILAEHFWADKVEQAAAPLQGLTKPGAGASEADMAAYAQAETEAQENLYGIDATGEPMAGAFIFNRWETGAFAENQWNPDFYARGAVVRTFPDGAYSETKEGAYDFTAYGDPSGEPDLEFTVGPYVNSTVFSIYGSQDAAILALKNGEIDFMLNPLGLQRGLLNQVEGDPNLTVIENPTNGFRYMTFNTRRKPMDDIAFRQAVAVLIDKEFVTSTILQGVAFPLHTFVPQANEQWYFGEVPKFGLHDDGTPMTREERINEAVRILEEAGYSWEGGTKPAWNVDNRAVDPGGRLILPDGTPMQDINLLAPSAGYDPLRSTFAIWIETWLKEAGIPVTANLTGFNVIVQKMFSEQDFDLSILGWSLGIFPSFLRDFFHSEQAVVDGNNAGGYSNPEFDQLSDQLLTCDTVEACKQISDQIQTLLATELPYVLLFDTGIIETYRSDALEYPYTDTLSGLQYLNGMPALVMPRQAASQ